MKRKLLTQIKNEWRDNIWLLVSLTVVVIALWALSTILYAKTQGIFTPIGVDPENVYSTTLKQLDKDNPAYTESEDRFENRRDFFAILNHIRENPHIEAAGFHWGALPYNYNYNGTNLYVEGDTIQYYGNQRSMSPDMVKVLRLESLTGSSGQDLFDALERGEMLLSDGSSYEEHRNPLDLKGAKVFIGGDTTNTYRVGDVIHCIRRSDYEPALNGVIVKPLSEEKLQWGNVAIRVKPGHGRQFVEDFYNDKDMRERRNVYLSDLSSLMDIRENCQRSEDITNRFLVIVIVFLFLVVFLGLLGTFYFRIQQRTKEIALRMVCGATHREIFSRVITEGMMLLAGAVIIATAVMWPIAHNYLDELDITWKSFLIFEIISVILVAIAIVLGLASPALRAMRVHPAEALKNE